MEFDALYDRWAEAEEVDEETLQLIRDTLQFIGETDDEEEADRCGDLLSGVFHLAADSEDLAKIDQALGQ